MRIIVAAMNDTRGPPRSSLNVRLVALKLVLLRTDLFRLYPAVVEACMRVLVDLELPLVEREEEARLAREANEGKERERRAPKEDLAVRRVSVRDIVRDTVRAILELDKEGTRCSSEIVTGLARLLIRIAGNVSMGKYSLTSPEIDLVVGVVERYKARLGDVSEVIKSLLLSKNPAFLVGLTVLARCCALGHIPNLDSLAPLLVNTGFRCAKCLLPGY